MWAAGRLPLRGSLLSPLGGRRRGGRRVPLPRGSSGAAAGPFAGVEASGESPGGAESPPPPAGPPSRRGSAPSAGGGARPELRGRGVLGVARGGGSRVPLGPGAPAPGGSEGL